MFKKIILGLIIILVAVGSYTYHYRAWYYLLLWKIDHTAEGSAIIDSTEQIKAISRHIEPFLERTYTDLASSDKARQAAALGLIAANTVKAESIFKEYLQKEDSEIKARAIYNLSETKNPIHFPDIVAYKDSQNPRVRRAVADYLKNVPTEESRRILIDMMENDSEEDVRVWAEYSLQQFGTLETK